VFTAALFSIFALDQNLASIAAQYWWALYAVMFLVIFAETGLVVFPFLPGDSFLFVGGAVAAVAGLNVHALVALLIVAAILGDSVNYAVGRYVGPKVFSKAGQPGFWRFVKPEYLRYTQEFYDKYGGFTIVIGRFVPIVRTFAPFMAGVAQMPYRIFLPYNILGGVVWIVSMVYAGFFFGNIPWVKDNLKWVVLAIIVISLLPIGLKVLSEKRKAGKRG
jgi:membrane-associated protein